MARVYRVGEFAELTGVTVRTLHHYDRVGLLKPSARSESGYRLYSEADLLKLQQVLTLRHLGFKLRQIGELMAREDFDIAASMRIQSRSLKTQIERMRRVDSAIERLLSAHSKTGKWDWDLVLAASNAVQQEFDEKDRQMTHNFSPEQMEQAKRLRDSLPDGYVEDVEDRWTTLIADIKRNIDADPASAEAKALAARWDELLAETMSAWDREPGLTDAIAEGYQKGVFESNPHAPSPEVVEFVERAKSGG